MDNHTLLEQDRQYVWHPYSNISPDNPLFAVESAQGCTLHLTNGQAVIDGMSSWWSTIHGYNHPALNAAVSKQLSKMAHVMFGGLTHEPAVTLAKQLVDMTPKGLDRVFFADSGSIAVEVACKMALQYWIAKKRPEKGRFLAFEGGYHGDTFGTMSICDPHNGMHGLFAGRLIKDDFLPRPMPPLRTGEKAESVCTSEKAGEHFEGLRKYIQSHAKQLAGVIIEPIAQNAGGMYFYSPAYLKQLKALCLEYDVLLIADEIATGFGRTGKLFGCDHAAISPDIMCLGKALTGGYMTLAATLCSEEIAQAISDSEASVLMHGPTFMANPLACATANASLKLLQKGQWLTQVLHIEHQLKQQLIPLKDHEAVADTRVLGAIGVIELKQAVDMKTLQPFIVEQGIWLRPFGKLLYTMPPYIVQPEELQSITQGMAASLDFHIAN